MKTIKMFGYSIPANHDCEIVVDALNAKAAKYPESSDFRDGEKAEGFWFDLHDGKVVRVEQVVGQSGVYLKTTNGQDEVVSDTRPWQMFA